MKRDYFTAFPDPPKMYRPSVNFTGSRRARSRKMKLYKAVTGVNIHTIKRIGDPIILSTALGTTKFAISGGSSYISTTSNTVATGGDDLAITNACQFGFALRFCLDALGSNKTDITTLFDNYRIKKVRLMFSYSSSDSNVNLAGQSSMSLPLMHYAIDTDTGNAPANEVAVLQNEKVKSKRLGDGIFYLDVYPRARAVVGTGTTGSTAAVGGLLPKNTWLDCDTTDVMHFGVQAWMRHWPLPNASAYQAALTMTPKYYIECKNQV